MSEYNETIIKLEQMYLLSEPRKNSFFQQRTVNIDGLIYNLSYHYGSFSISGILSKARGVSMFFNSRITAVNGEKSLKEISDSVSNLLQRLYVEYEGVTVPETTEQQEETINDESGENQEILTEPNISDGEIDIKIENSDEVSEAEKTAEENPGNNTDTDNNTEAEVQQ